MSFTNFAALQSLTSVNNSDQFLVSLNNGLSGASGFGRVATAAMEKSLSVYSTVQSNSATTWNYQGTDIKALTANWQSTYTGFSTQSANNASVYSTVNANSATTWNYQGTDIKALTANWQSTYTTVSAQSANNASVYSTVNANSGKWTVFTGTVSAATFVASVTSTAAANYRFALTDASRTIIDTFSTNTYYGVPSNNTVAFPTGSQLVVIQGNKTASNYTVLSAGSGVTINSFSNSLSLAGNYAAGTLIKTDTNVWYLIGNLK